MQELIIVDPTPIYADISWIGDPYNYGPPGWAMIPYNNIASTTSDISLAIPGVIKIKRPGIYSFTGVVTPEKMLSYFYISISKNDGPMTQFIHSNATNLAAAETFTHSIPFAYTLNVTKDDVMANSDMSCHLQIKIQTGVSNYLKGQFSCNWVHVTKIH
jgi:hypothetical protein